MIAHVVFNLPLERAFDYLVPRAWEGTLCPGMRVVAPFGQRQLIGYVSRLVGSSPISSPKTLLRLLDPIPVLFPAQWRLARWVAQAYCCSLGEACANMVPAKLRIHQIQLQDEVPARAGGDSPRVLTTEQQHAFAIMRVASNKSRSQIFLLHGVTGSGKTELYLRLIEEALRHGRSAICLVPEIAMTPQAIDRFRQRFGTIVSLWHSRLTARQRSQEWQRMTLRSPRVVVGTRSAVFAPVHELGVIVLDEEHDPSYKQEQSPRYHAREVAIARARMAKALVILGSATPSVESYYAAKTNRYHLLELTKRIENRPLPQVEIIDMRQEFRGRRTAALSPRLQQTLQHVLDRQEQAILLLNRRGFARVAHCPACGTVVRCTRCSVPLIYHAALGQLSCHYCNFRLAPPETCPSCRQGYLRFRGVGTERIESTLHQLFPATEIARMDTDTTKARESHRELYEAIKTQQIDVLVGTQMVAKGLDVPQVTLVGVVSADTALNLPDFRAGERTFDLLAQVSGRAGRGDRPGRVLIQTYCPGHYAIQAASRHDYQAFYRAEIRMRKRLNLPPFTRLVELTIQGSNSARVQEAAGALGRALGPVCRRHRIGLFGPVPHRIPRLRRTTRWRLVLKARQIGSILTLVRRVLREGRRFHALPVIVDVDPL